MRDYHDIHVRELLCGQQEWSIYLTVKPTLDVCFFFSFKSLYEHQER